MQYFKHRDFIGGTLRVFAVTLGYPPGGGISCTGGPPIGVAILYLCRKAVQEMEVSHMSEQSGAGARSSGVNASASISACPLLLLGSGQIHAAFTD
jgi:hypothetical protein